MKAEQKRGLLAKPQQDREEKTQKTVPVGSKETNSVAEGRIWIILTKYQVPKFWNNFIFGKHLTQSSDPCFTPLKQLEFFAFLLVLFVQSLRMKIYYKKMTVPVTMDTTLDKLKGNLYTPTGNLVLTICWTLKAFLCLDVWTQLGVQSLQTEVKLNSYKKRFHTFILLIFDTFPSWIVKYWTTA